MTEQDRATRGLLALMSAKGFPVCYGRIDGVPVILHPRSREWDVFEFARSVGVEEGNLNVLYPEGEIMDAATFLNPSPMSIGAITDNLTRIHLN